MPSDPACRRRPGFGCAVSFRCERTRSRIRDDAAGGGLANEPRSLLAFSFLILIGAVLVIESSHRHIPKGYIYFAMAFAIGVEMLNLKVRKRAATPVHLHRAA